MGILSNNAEHAGETTEDTGSYIGQYSVNSSTASDTKEVPYVINNGTGELTI